MSLLAFAPPRSGDFTAALRIRLRHAALGLLVPLTLVLVWALASAQGWLPEQILPAPSFVWQNLCDMAASGELAQHAGISAIRVAAGFAVGAGLGLLLGIAIGLSRPVEDYVRPLFTAVAQVPTIGWIPLLMLFLGIGETLKIVVIAKAAFFPMVVNTAAGIRNIPVSYKEVAAVLRLTRWQSLRRLVLPGALPPIFTGVRYSLTKAWTALVAVELLASAEGLGYLLVWSRQMFWLDTMLAAMLIIGLVGYVMDAMLAAAETRLQAWRIDA
ncbi:ABC transporter permease [Methylobacterium pseudosasicola]|uniref:Sulfonate transport system permease protein n=1 Tax=Methylobacterium pseudosasicola TaxID=582667 RepID=A0A1I4Q523_9HYPH|nr:ABC transporter permease [Methylobacterium pseudosasicola]SFM35198.1 sulfonate transport system permease protein [Methylobacterium pseudosasicola]